MQFAHPNIANCSDYGIKTRFLFINSGEYLLHLSKARIILEKNISTNHKTLKNENFYF